MNPDDARWRHIDGLLQTLVELPTKERAAHIAHDCGPDQDLADEVSRLLAGEGRLPDVLPTVAFGPVADDFLADDAVGRRIGAYVIETLIGEGGMSRVYRASRATDFRQCVAVKLLRTRPDATALQRFRIERDALAGLSHPGIVRLLDAGMSAQGDPWLAMDLVEGRPWRQWLDEDVPDLDRRLAMLVEVCDALQHAHLHALVHRDLKPANLMVDKDGHARLLDFGVARLIGDGSGTLTRDAGVAMTPAYASPEQLRGETATIASDLYALGMIVHETLSGTDRFARAEWTTALQRATQDLPRPSEIRTATGISARLLRGDLDNIVRKACAVDPGLRYASAAALGEDLVAVRSGRPVSARAPTWGYVLSKFVRRHPLGMAAALLATIAIAATTATALREGERAERRFAEARTFAHSILFDYQQPLADLPGTLQVRRRMIDDSLRYLDSLRDVAGDDQGLWQELAEGYLRIGDLQGHPLGSNLGDFAAAARSYSEAEAALRHWTSLRPDAAASTLLEAQLASSQAAIAHQNGALEEAATLYRRSVSLFASLAQGQMSDDVRLVQAQTLDQFADLLDNAAQPSLLDATSASTHRAKAETIRTALLASHPDAPALLYALALSRIREGDTVMGARRLDDAERLYGDARVLVEKAIAAEPNSIVRRRELASIDARLALLHDLQGRHADAIDAAQRSARLVETLLVQQPDDDTLRQGVGAALGTLAKFLIADGRLDEAAPVVDRQIEVNQIRLDGAPDNPELVLALSLGYRRRAELEAGRGRIDAAIAAHERALALQSTIASQSAYYESNRTLSLLHIGRLEARRHDHKRARVLLDDAVAAIRALLAQHPGTPMFIEDLADALEARGDVEGRGRIAQRHHREALAVLAQLDAAAASAMTVKARTQRLQNKIVDASN